MIRRKTGISFKSFLGGRVLRYPCVIEPSHGDTEYGVIFPDLAGCYATGTTLDEALKTPRKPRLSGSKKKSETEGKDRALPTWPRFQRIRPGMGGLSLTLIQTWLTQIRAMQNRWF